MKNNNTGKVFFILYVNILIFFRLQCEGKQYN